MPEGDTIHRTAEVLRRALRGAEVIGAEARYGPRHGPPPDLSRIVGSTVTGVEPRGKHLLIHFSGGLTLHTHLGMRGTWHSYPAAAAPRRVLRAAARLETARFVVACFSPAVLALADSRAVDRLPALASLGPDVLADAFDAGEARRRLRERPGTTVSEALLDQRAVAGLGNVYKSELLFLAGVHPLRRVADLEDRVLDELLARARTLAPRNVHGGTRVTTSAAAARAGAPLWVYGRSGRPCRRCGTRIRSERAGAAPRTTYWCPTCQPGPAAA